LYPSPNIIWVANQEARDRWGGRPRLTWEDIQMDLIEIGWEGMKCIGLA
jgi:hypothetical protein